MKLTPKMKEVLRSADLERSEIGDVPMSTMYALESRKLISGDWRRGSGYAVYNTSRGTFPVYKGVKLLPAGVRAARSVQGLSGNI